ncbi:hypothetical protein ENUP19_0079G0054 [Entamoeba nuttalli]|uniref:Phospholipase B-like n=2 Tax=Entamoeba nuttalli TaxID=412467 RepID=A0ABQ0DES0_9EUKA
MILNVLLISLAFADTFSKSGCYIEKGEYKVEMVQENKEYLVVGTFNDTLFIHGWGFLHLNSIQSTSLEMDLQLAKCAGLVEGYLTSHRIRDHMNNQRASNVIEEWDKVTMEYINRNIAYSKQQAKDLSLSDPWGRALGIVLAQTFGIREGAIMKEPGLDMTETDIFILNSDGDLSDLQNIAAHNLWPEMKGFKHGNHTRFSDAWYDVHHHCTGLIRLTPNYQDLFVAQDTWSSPTTMNRILKEYHIQYFDKAIGSKRILFSSYPGITHSLDDFWLMDNGLAVIETTMHCWNQDQFEKCTPDSILTWIRVQIANLLSSKRGSGVQWAKNFIRENSGTYNNQYIIIDYNKFKPGKRPQPGTLYAIEQMPGYYGAGDRTEELIKNGYIPSVNAPFFNDVYKYAGVGEKCEADNDWYFDYWKSDRMKLIQRDAPHINTYEDFKKFMRYNGYPNDPLVNDPGQFILSRYDLRPKECVPSPTNPTILHCPSNFGGLDSKTINYERAISLKIDAISSPQYENQPAYEFGKKPFDTAIYNGLPEKWTFPWIVFNEDGF